MAVLFDFLKPDLAADLTDDGQVLRLSALEQLLDTGQTLGDILRAGDAAGVEGSHGQLSAGLADGLGAMIPTASPTVTGMPLARLEP